MSELYFKGGNPIEAISGLVGTDELKEASAEDLRVLICLLSGERDGAKIAKAVSCSLARVRGALAFWQGCGVLTEENAPQKTEKTVPLRSARELAPKSEAEDAAYIEEGEKKSLVDECQRIMGRLFNPTEIGIVVGLSEQLGLDDAYILTLLSFCVSRNKKTMRYVEKTAFGLFDEGIDTTSALEDYIHRLEAVTSFEGKLRKLFGIGERTLSKTEQACFTRWVCDFGFDMSVISLAYDITVDTRQKALVKYVDSILARWHGAGCRTLVQVEALLEREKVSHTMTKTAKRTEPRISDGGGSFNTDDFFAKALARSYGEGDNK